MRLIDADALMEEVNIEIREYMLTEKGMRSLIRNAPTIDAVEVVRCKECKHRPIKEDTNGENYGFNLIEPTEGDERCPCLVSDGWYSWMPNDNFYCGYGEREGE